jgi:hypothetical protein
MKEAAESNTGTMNFHLFNLSNENLRRIQFQGKELNATAIKVY